MFKIDVIFNILKKKHSILIEIMKHIKSLDPLSNIKISFSMNTVNYRYQIFKKYSIQLKEYLQQFINLEKEHGIDHKFIELNNLERSLIGKKSEYVVNNIIEEYEDELSDEDLDGGVSSSSIYNLYIKNHNADENFVSDNIAINSPEISSEISSNLAQENNELSLNFADDLSIADEKLFGNSSTNSLNNSLLKQENLKIENQSSQNNQPINSDNMKTSEVTLFSKLSRQVNKEKTLNLNSENFDENNHDKTNHTSHSELDFHEDHLDLKIDDLNNFESKDNLINQVKIKTNNSEINNKSQLQQNLNQQANKNDIDLEFEKELTNLDLDNSLAHQNNHEQILAVNSDSKIDNLKVDNAQGESILFAQKNQTLDKVISSIESQDYQQINSLTDNNSMQISSKDDLDDDLEIASKKLFGSNQENILGTQQNQSKPIDIANTSQLLGESVDNSLFSTSDNHISQNIENDDDIKHRNIDIASNNSNSINDDWHKSKQDLHDFENDHLVNANNENHNYQVQITKPILHEEVIIQSTNSIQKLLDTKEMISGISNFMQSPYPIEIAVQLMEPKLEKWMNENLSSIVEKIVRDEISKIIPKS
jgi:cell pole-organizing protein PopZ